MTTLFHATITEIGPDVPMIAEENMLIFFDEKSPKELHDVAVVHKGGSLAGEIKTGDTLVLGKQAFPILYVGETVNGTLRDLGHFTVNFNGVTDQTLPGSIYVKSAAVPEVSAGLTLRLIRE